MQRLIFLTALLGLIASPAIAQNSVPQPRLPAQAANDWQVIYYSSGEGQPTSFIMVDGTTISVKGDRRAGIMAVANTDITRPILYNGRMVAPTIVRIHYAVNCRTNTYRRGFTYYHDWDGSMITQTEHFDENNAARTGTALRDFVDIICGRRDGERIAGVHPWTYLEHAGRADELLQNAPQISEPPDQ
jgi:hypothetical protein